MRLFVHHPWLPVVAAGALVALAACGGDEATSAATKAPDTAAADTAADAAAKPGHTSALPSPFVAPSFAAAGWTPQKVLLLDAAVRRRGLQEVRGLIHAHSPYSHDACDNKPFDENGKINVECVEDFRRDLCHVGHNFVFLTDHPGHFKEHEFPDVLHYDPKRGDKLVERDGKTVGSWMACPDGRSVLLMPGTEGGMMPIGLNGHIGDKAARDKWYGGMDVETRKALIAGGARVIAQHTEDWTTEQLQEEGWGGFEMYNLHANMVAQMKAAAQMIPVLLDEKETMNPDLLLLPLLQEDPRYLKTWAELAEAGTRLTSTLGTDCHRNTFNLPLSDNERVDSYRRMMIWFSNHLLIQPGADGSHDDTALKAAVDARRLFGVFEVFGHAEGFDARIETAKGVVEIGGDASLADAPRIVADTPHLAFPEPGVDAPLVRSRVVRAKDGAWTEVASGDGRVEFSPTEPGGYRVEVRLTPKHLRKHLGSKQAFADQEFVWIYANVFTITK